jgi:tRNA 2-(methylsulfanyl)-N6-isopentenyladenosine37 hydroxylase
MLGLKLPTDPRWVNLVDKSIEEILTDHAYCEQKAASSGITLIVNYPDLEDLVEEVTKVVDEEWGHFRLVLAELKKRNLRLGRLRKDDYVNALHKKIKSDGSHEGILLDRLLMCALIEARSCERFKLLSQQCADMDLREFYKKLMVSEAGHYKLFLDFAYKYIGKEKADTRWQFFLKTEADIIESLDLRGDRMH